VLEKEELILNYLGRRSTMILSTFGEEGPWVTPVFYVNRSLKLYFLSELSTRHSMNLQYSNAAAVAITEDHKDWRTIQGLQLQGISYLVSGEGEIAAALAAYCRKFPAVRHILQNPAAFKGVAAARWHCFLPESLKFTDNTTNFGEKVELKFKLLKTKNGFDLSGN